MNRLIFLLGIIFTLFFQHGHGQNCKIDFDLPTGIDIPEDKLDVFYTRTSTGVVTKIDILHKVDSTFIVNEYLEASVNPDTKEVSFQPTARLALEYLDLPKDNGNKYTLPIFDGYVRYTCDDGITVEPSASVLLLTVIDVNNRNPTFEISSYNYPLPVPIKGTPFNWDKPIKVFDKDLLPEYNTLTFESSNPLVLVTFERFETPYGFPERQRLDYYNVYLRLADNFDETAPLDPVTITATDGTHKSTADVEITFQKIDPYVKMDIDFNQIPLKNEPGSIDIATISADHSATLDGDFADAYEVTSTPIFEINEQKAAKLSLELKRELTSAELGPNAAVKLTLKVENADNTITENLVLLYEKPAANEFKQLNYIIDITNADEVSKTADLNVDVGATYSIDPPEPSYMSFDPTTGKITCQLSEDDLLKYPGVDVFTVIADLDSKPHTTIIIYKHPPVITIEKPLYEKNLDVAEVGTIDIGWDSDVSDVVLTVEPSNSYLTIDPADGVTVSYDVDQTELETRPGVDIFVITATTQTGGAAAKTTVAISKNAPIVKIENPVVPPVIVTEPPELGKEIYQVLLLTPQPPNVQFSIKPHGTPTPRDYLTIDKDGKIFCDLTQEEIGDKPGMDTFTITVSSAIVGGSSAEMGFTVVKDAQDATTSPPTEPPECTTLPTTECPTSTPCVCETTPTECPTTQAATECPPCSTQPECPITYPETSSTYSPVTQPDCPTCPPVTEPSTCPPTAPPVTDATECPTTCPPTDSTYPTPTECPITCPPTDSTCLTPTECPITCPPTDSTYPTPTECPITCPPTDSTCPTPTECPITCPPTDSTSQPVPECPTTLPPTDSTCPTPTECPITCPPTDSTSQTVPECPTTLPPTDSSCPPCPSTSTDSTGAPTDSSCPPTPECPTTLPPTTELTSPPEPECPTTCPTPTEPATCPTTECPISCPPSVTGPTTPTDGAPVTCPTPIECPVTCPPPPVTEPPVSCPPIVPPDTPGDEDCDCSTTGLVAGVAVLGVVSCLSAGAAAYLAYTYLYKGGTRALANLQQVGTDYSKLGDPEVGTNSPYNTNRNSYGGSLQGTEAFNSASYGNGDFAGNGSLGTSGGAPTFQQGSIPRGGGFGGTETLAAVAPIGAAGLFAAAVTKPTSSTQSEPEYSYAKSASDVPVASSNPEIARKDSLVESLYSKPISEAGRKASILTEPTIDEVPVDEPKVDYNRVTFVDDVVEVPGDESPETEGTDDVGEEEENDSEQL